MDQIAAPLPLALWRTRSTLLAAALVLAACGGGTPSPSATPGPPGTPPGSGPPAPTSDDPGGSGDPVPSVPGGEMSAGSEVLVVADEVRVRAEPGTEGEILGTLPWATAGTVRSGPVESDGYAWYEVETEARTGWTAAGDGEDRWIVPIGPGPGADVLLTFSEVCDVVPPLRVPTTAILADGSVVVGRGDLRIGRLNEDGMALIRQEVLDLPVLQQPGTYEPQPLPDAEPPGHGACAYTFVTGAGADAVTVNSVMWFGDQEEAEFYVPSPERKLLSGVARSLGEIDTLLEEDLWSETPRPYAATEFLLVLMPFPGPTGGEAIPYQELGLPGPDELEAAGGDTRCGTIPLEQAVTATREIRASGNPVSINEMPSATADDDGQGWSVIIAPRTPSGAPTCDDVYG
jgi:hypothetical protein